MKKMDKGAVMMTNADARGQGYKEAKEILNVKVHPDTMLGIVNLVDERYSGGKSVVA